MKLEAVNIRDISGITAEDVKFLRKNRKTRVV